MKKALCIALAICACFVLSCKKDNTKGIEQQAKEPHVEQKEVRVENREGFPLNLSELSQEEKEKILVGVWNLFFPTPNNNWGYRFQKDYEFRYVDNSDKAALERYKLSRGRWRLTKTNDIEIINESYLEYNKDAEESGMGLSFPLDAELIEVPIENSQWIKIGSLESVRTGIVIEQWDFPPQIILHPILFDTVLENEIKYYKFSDE